LSEQERNFLKIKSRWWYGLCCASDRETK
jgi:hypothetical protein